ncbi:MAG: Ig-like domain-containing protein [Natrialbaceae archaeon]|nr:Ig-like domain-containing protein [Natrialbaceae archaeon]
MTLDDPHSDYNLSTSLDVGQTTNVSAIGWFEHRASNEVTAQANWTSSDPGIVSITETNQSFTRNVLTALSPGTAEITAEYQGQTASVNITVNGTTPSLESIDLTLDDATLNVSETTNATVLAHYDDNSSSDVTSNATITSLNTTVATVSGNLVTASAAGTSTIEASVETLTNTTTLTVTE